MNQPASRISLEYIEWFRLGLNAYILLAQQKPYEQLQGLRDEMWRLGMLVEIWTTIETRSKEKKNG